VRKVCALEGAEDGVLFGSGMAAISTTLLTLLQAGDHAVLQDDLYGGTHAFVAELFQRLGIAFDFVGLTPAEIEGALTPKTKVIFLESPTNPLLHVVDLRPAWQAHSSVLRSGCGIQACHMTPPR
jgi:cystathionine beta-lyase